MPIVETKLVIRPDTSVPFFDDINDSVVSSTKTTIGYVLLEKTPTYFKLATPDGKVTRERFISDNGLEQQAKVTFESLADYNRVENIISINLDCEYKQYSEDHGFVHPPLQYAQTGIDQPFSCTTTYNYTATTLEVYPEFTQFTNFLESSDNLVSYVNTGSQIIAIHEYLNSEDFTNHHWADFTYVQSLKNGGVTRTLNYALL